MNVPRHVPASLGSALSRLNLKIALSTALLVSVVFLLFHTITPTDALDSVRHISSYIAKPKYDYGVTLDNGFNGNQENNLGCEGHAQDDTHDEHQKIPNTAHFTYVLEDPAADFKFKFSHYLSVYSAWYYDCPHAIYLSVNANNESIARAINGDSGKWTKLIFNMPGLRINHVEVPKKAGSGVEITGMEHKSDFVRVKAMYELGGVYRDFDVHTLRPLRPLLQSGFHAVLGRAYTGIVNSGIFLSGAKSKFISMWIKDMHTAFDGSWARHSDETITRLCDRLAGQPNEVLIMERAAFAPGGWDGENYNILFGGRNDTKSNLDGIEQGDEMPSHTELLTDRWNHPDRFPEWEKDYSNTYLLHAFSPSRSGFKITNFEHISPRYVLERLSNFARATYPVAKSMYDRGIIEIDDAFDA